MKQFYFLLAFLPLAAFAQSPVTASPGAAVTSPSSACLACPGSLWNNPNNVMAADNNNATAGMMQNGNCFQSSCFYTRFLYAYNFGFSIPAGATIDSILVDVLRSSPNAASVRDSIIQLYDGSSLVGSNLADPSFWPVIAATQSYGHNDPLWSYAWTPAMLNSSGFGVMVKAVNETAVQVAAAIDHIQVTVYYTVVTGGSGVSSSAGSVKWIDAPGKISANISLAATSSCRGEIFDITGKLVQSDDYGMRNPGEQQFDFHTSDLPEGIYSWRIYAGNEIFVRKIAVVK